MSIHVLKLGGGSGIDHAAVLQDLATRVEQGEQWVLVHGVSDTANRMAISAGITVETITSPGGHVSRYTNATMIGVYEQAVVQVNNELVAQLAHHGIRAQGFPVASVIQGERKTAIRAIRNGRQIIIRDDYSGRIIGTQVDEILGALNAGLVPVVAPIALGLEGESLNVDGDLVAAELARVLEAETLVILSNVPGLLRDIDDDTSIIMEFSLPEIERYSHFAVGRMKKKLIAAETAQVRRVILGDARTEWPLQAALNGSGTHILGGIHVQHHA